MSKKEKVSILRTDDFEVVDEALSEAISGLETTNVRIAELLEQQSTASEEELLVSEEGAQAEVAPPEPAQKEDTVKDASSET